MIKEHPFSYLRFFKRVIRWRKNYYSTFFMLCIKWEIEKILHFQNWTIHFTINLLKKEVEWKQIIDSYIYKLPNISLFLYFEWEKYALKYIKKILKRSNNWYRNPWFKLSYIDYNNCQYRKMKLCSVFFMLVHSFRRRVISHWLHKYLKDWHSSHICI